MGVRKGKTSFFLWILKCPWCCPFRSNWRDSTGIYIYASLCYCVVTWRYNCFWTRQMTFNCKLSSARSDFSPSLYVDANFTGKLEWRFFSFVKNHFSTNTGIFPSCQFSRPTYTTYIHLHTTVIMDRGVFSATVCLFFFFFFNWTLKLRRWLVRKA